MHLRALSSLDLASRCSCLKSVDLAQPDVSDGYLRRRSFELDTDETGDVVGALEVVVDEDGHQLAIDNVHHHRPARDDLVLIPAVDVDVAAECLTWRNVGNERVIGRVARLRAGGLGDLTTPGEDAESSVFAIELAAVLVMLGIDREPEVGLRSRHQPCRFGQLLPRTCANPRLPDGPAILDAGAAAELDLDLQLEVEVVRLGFVVIRAGTVIADVGVRRPDGRRIGLTADGTILDAPDRGVAVPATTRLAVADLF